MEKLKALLAVILFIATILFLNYEQNQAQERPDRFTQEDTLYLSADPDTSVRYHRPAAR